MNRWISLPLLAALTSFPLAAWAQGGYTVMTGTPVAPPPTASPGTPTIVAPPAPAGQEATAQITPTSQITPSNTRGVGRTVAPRRPEEYGGITPGMPALPRGFRRARRPAGASLITWPGFQVVPGGSRLFVVLTSPQPLGEAMRNGRTRVYRIPGTRIHLWNNHRPLITEAFPTPVSRAYLRSVRGVTELVVELRADIEPSITQETSGQGFHYVFLNFPSFQAPEVARILLPNGVVDTASPATTGTTIAPAPQVTVGAPRPGTDTEHPPAIR